MLTSFLRTVLELVGLAPAVAVSLPAGDCSYEKALGGRTDVVFCEPWEKDDWWRAGYVAGASTSRPVAARPADVANTRVVSDGCVSGSCLRVEMKQYQSGALAVHWPLKAAGLAPEQLHLRYYLKLGRNFDPQLCTPAGKPRQRRHVRRRDQLLVDARRVPRLQQG
jgi:hypothetical protein